MTDPSIAIIIPVKEFNERLKKSVEQCLQLENNNLEILVFPDYPFSEFADKIRIIPTGNMGPALKRDLALKYSNAELFAFLDDDAYPEKDWLDRAIIHFQARDVAAVGGPSVTPPESSLPEHISGHIYSSVAASGSYTYRYIPGKRIIEVEDYPSCNFIVRREIFEQLGGFDNNFWPGEDTKLCLDITKKLGKKIIYDPQVLVYHHRRNFGPAHFKQVASYALHRGFFAKYYPETSRKFAYFMPSLLLTYLVLGSMAAYFNRNMRVLFFASLCSYLGLITVSVLIGIIKDKFLTADKKILLIFPVIFGIIATHLCYGTFFIKGLISRKLKEQIE